jgi:hypothetical protein
VFTDEIGTLIQSTLGEQIGMGMMAMPVGDDRGSAAATRAAIGAIASERVCVCV